jgi:type VI secretion system protein ImpL
MLKFIFGAIFIALSWALALVFKEHVPMWTAGLATGVIAGSLLIYAIIKMVIARRAAAAIEKGLRDQAMRQREGMRPDLEAQISAMEAEFNKAVSTLKGSKLGRSGKDVLGILPWYVIIGPPGSGKTTAIQTCGLKFPMGRNSSVRGVGGTRNCAWWMTNEAIILDTAGRWSVEDDDRDEWLAFLDLLKKTRPKRPVNGILLAVSTTEMQGTEDELADLARALRERIDEVIGRLEMVVPVYLLITKCDLLPGFIETFGDFGDKDRGQIWGFTLPLVSEHADHVEAVAQHFDDLGETLERKAFLRMGEERRVEARENIRAFPQQFDSLRQGLIDLVANLFDQNVYRDGPIMRGVYFSSGTQEGRPIDRVMASMAEAFGVRPRMEATAPTKPKSYFVRDVFQHVVFPDRDLAVASAGALRRQRLMRWGIAAAALVVSVAALILPISSYLENDRFVTASRTFVEHLARSRAEAVREKGRGESAPFTIAPLESAEPTSARLAGFASNGPDVSLRFGLYPGESLMMPLRMAVERLVVRPVLDTDAERLLGLARAGGDSAQAIRGLTLQLLLSQPKAPDEPAPENDDGWRKEWVPIVVKHTGDRWASLEGEAAASARARRTIENATSFWLLGVESSEDLLDRGPRAGVISRVRTALRGEVEGDPLSDLIHDPNLPRDLRLVDVVGGAVGVLQKSGSEDKKVGGVISGAFTPDGWKVVRERIERLSVDEPDKDAWVFGGVKKRKAIDPQPLRTAYFRRYIEAWRSLLLSLSLREPVGIEETRAMLRTLTTDKPLDAVWRNLGRELQLKPEPGIKDLAKALKVDKKLDKLEKLNDDVTGDDSTARRARERVGEPTNPEHVPAEFSALLSFGLTKPTGLDTYNQILAELAVALGDKGTPDAKNFQAVLSAQRLKLTNLISSYNENGWEGQLLSRILMPPLRGAEIAVEGASGGSANRKWCDGIVVLFDQTLAGRYPFAGAKAQREARIADVEKFFLPKSGALWQYYTESLAAEIEHPPGTTLFRFKEDTSIKYKPTLLVFLKRAQELSDLLYGRDPAKLGVAASIRLHPSAPYAKIVLEAGGKKVTYFNTKERWDDLVWPSRGALLRLYQKSGESDELGYPDGEWALHHLIENGKPTVGTDAGEEVLTSSWATPLHDATVRADFKPANLLRAFRAIDVPRAIVNGVSGCGK